MQVHVGNSEPNQMVLTLTPGMWVDDSLCLIGGGALAGQRSILGVLSTHFVRQTATC